jgi:osmotically-inducible protein OsmY
MVNLLSRLPRGRPAAQRSAARRRVRASAAARGIAPRLAAVLGAFGMGVLADRFIFDRANARRRRHMARERGLAKLRRRSREAVRRAKYTEGVAEGVAHRAAHAMPGVGKRKEPLDDVSLAQKVEGEAFRQAGVSKAHVSVNAERGVVYLRGRLDSEREIEKLVRATGAVEGVTRVENKLHTPQGATSQQGS